MNQRESAAYFDVAAMDYDNSFSFSAIGKLQRQQVYAFLPDVAAKKILEMNGGTGEDAVYFAEKKAFVTTTDVSEQMLAVIAAKAQHYPNIHCTKWNLTQPFNNQENITFDMAFSDFGGWNCLTKSEIQRLSEELSHLIAAKGKLIVVVMPRFCLWESLYFLCKGAFGKAFRRLSKVAIDANVDGVAVPTYYYSPKDIAQLLSPHFDVLKLQPIGIAIPPSYLAPFFAKRPKLLQLLQGIEQKMSFFSFFAYASDHFYMELQLK